MRAALLVSHTYSPFLRRMALRLKATHRINFFFPGAESKFSPLFEQIQPTLLLTTASARHCLTARAIEKCECFELKDGGLAKLYPAPG
jgi:hypothetical protein